MDDAAVGAVAVEVDEPALPRGCLDPTALVRPLQPVCLATSTSRCSYGPQIDFERITAWGPVSTRRSARRYSTSRCACRAWALQHRQGLGVLDDHRAGVEHRLAVGGHAMQHEGSRADLAVDQIGLAVIIPEGAWVLKTWAGHDGDRSAPGALDLGRGGHEDPLIGGGEIDVEPAVVMPDRRRPHPAGVALARRAHLTRHPRAGIIGGYGPRQIVFGRERQLGQDVAGDRPMDEVLGGKDRHAGREVETGRHEVVGLADTDDIRIGIVGRQDRVAIDRRSFRPRRRERRPGQEPEPSPSSSPNRFTRITGIRARTIAWSSRRSGGRAASDCRTTGSP
jgi:hypothetical protein